MAATRARLRALAARVREQYGAGDARAVEDAYAAEVAKNNVALARCLYGLEQRYAVRGPPASTAEPPGGWLDAGALIAPVLWVTASALAIYLLGLTVR